MNQFLFIIVTFCVGFFQIRLSEGFPNQGIGTDIITILRLTNNNDLIFHHCKVNNQSAIEHDLEEVCFDFIDCLEQKTVRRVTQDVYLEHLEQCSQPFRIKSKLCLNDKHQYFPDILLDVDKDTVSEQYELKLSDAYSKDVYKCGEQLRDPLALDAIDKCSERTHENSFEIPESKELFCELFITKYDCIVNVIKGVCDDNDNIAKYRKYVKSHYRIPCGEKEVK